LLPLGGVVVVVDVAEVIEVDVDKVEIDDLEVDELAAVVIVADELELIDVNGCMLSGREKVPFPVSQSHA
jgi:hypothetical protein